ncbi:Mariner Mos1 transposase [Eumeta japonica]|uniref:Mariner Mos1 transposase n=1 Tax=Eumeta variegata TaxID=151549 RepID=A0A4C1ZX92_EUMVA|nr:Mariner Mos1 transposase [Eumeta japonica]
MGTTWPRVNIHSKAEYSWKKPHAVYLVGLTGWMGNTTPPTVFIRLSDYHVFRIMAHALLEQRCTSYEDTKNWVDSWIASKDKKFFRLGIRTLPVRW